MLIIICFEFNLVNKIIKYPTIGVSKRPFVLLTFEKLPFADPVSSDLEFLKGDCVGFRELELLVLDPPFLISGNNI